MHYPRVISLTDALPGDAQPPAQPPARSSRARTTAPDPASSTASTSATAGVVTAGSSSPSSSSSSARAAPGRRTAPVARSTTTRSSSAGGSKDCEGPPPSTSSPSSSSVFPRVATRIHPDPPPPRPRATRGRVLASRHLCTTLPMHPGRTKPLHAHATGGLGSAHVSPPRHTTAPAAASIRLQRPAVPARSRRRAPGAPAGRPTRSIRHPEQSRGGSTQLRRTDR